MSKKEQYRTLEIHCVGPEQYVAVDPDCNIGNADIVFEYDTLQTYINGDFTRIGKVGKVIACLSHEKFLPGDVPELPPFSHEMSKYDDIRLSKVTLDTYVIASKAHNHLSHHTLPVVRTVCDHVLFNVCAKYQFTTEDLKMALKLKENSELSANDIVRTIGSRHPTCFHARVIGDKDETARHYVTMIDVHGNENIEGYWGDKVNRLF